jgi:hypothetical protein
LSALDVGIGGLIVQSWREVRRTLALWGPEFAGRAVALGYGNVAWYPEGSDGWAAAGLPLEKRIPQPRP